MKPSKYTYLLYVNGHYYSSRTTRAAARLSKEFYKNLLKHLGAPTVEFGMYQVCLKNNTVKKVS
ncbi:hypothetical protein [Pseudomonas phage PP21]